MIILDALKRLRDDIKAWVTVNLNALNAKIDEKTIPIDSELSSTSTNPVQNKVIKDAIDNIPTFSGDYNDLTNAPDISEDGSGNMIIADESGNIIFKADADGIHTTAVSLNGETAATEKYVDDAVANIPTPDVSGQINAHNASEGAHTDIRQAIENAKEELSESIVAESDEWKVVDDAGNIIFSVDASGAHTTELTLNGESAATESYVDDAIANIEFPETDLTDYATKEYVDNAVDSVDFTGYATETYVDNKVADLVNSAPEALNTLGELATALENHEDAYDALLETVGGKATHTDLENLKDEISESIVSETDEFHIVDESGNIVASIDENGVATTTVTAQSIIVNGDNVEEHMDNTTIHVTAVEKEAWNNKSNFSGSYNDLTDKPAPTDLSNYYTKTEIDTAFKNVDIEESDPTVPAWAKEANKPTYTAEEVGLGNVDNTSDINKPVSTATQNALNELKSELSESIVSEGEEWTVVDNDGNIVAVINANGVETTKIVANQLIVNGVDVLESKVDKVEGKSLSTNDFTDEYKEKLDYLVNQPVFTMVVDSITLPANNWTGTQSPYSQVVEIPGITERSQIDMQPTIEQIIELQEYGIALMITNNNSVVTVYAINGKPTSDYTMQITIMDALVRAEGVSF